MAPHPHLPTKYSQLSRVSKGAIPTLFSAISFSSCSFRLLSIQAAVSSSQGSSSPSDLIFLRAGKKKNTLLKDDHPKDSPVTPKI